MRLPPEAVVGRTSVDANTGGRRGLACQTTALAQTQRGADIDGEAAEDLSGSSVSLSADGSRLAIEPEHAAPSTFGNSTLRSG